MTTNSSPYEPSLPWRTGSSIIMGLAGSLCRIFMFGASNTDTHGLDRFKALLDERADVDKRQRGLITGRHLDAQYAQYAGKLKLMVLLQFRIT